MPKVLSRQPRWLDYGTPAYAFFQPEDKAKAASNTGAHGPQRRIAHRGTELFAAVGDELRWSDLARLKEAESRHAGELPTYKVN